MAIDEGIIKRELNIPRGIDNLMKEIEGAETGKPSLIKTNSYTRRRIMGSEQEYGILTKNKNSNLSDSGWSLAFQGFLENGSYLYKDCGHPEYSSAEASNPLDAVIYDKAGEIIIQKAIVGNGIMLFKNNRDFENSSFASHESYSFKRANLEVLAQATLPFFTSRIIFAGSGFINKDGKYEMSQKAGVTTRDLSPNTTGDTKAIFNLKDESLMDNFLYMRLHVVSGDANLSEPALFLKFGTTGLVLDLFEDKKLRFFRLEDAVDTFRKISTDLKFERKYNVGGNGEMTAIEIQRFYQEAAEKAYRGRDDITDDILNRWKFVLDSLEKDPKVLDRWIDWVIKKKLIDSYMGKTGKSITDLAVKNIDLQYHDINRERGLFYKIQNSGMVDRLISDSQINYAVENAPKDTRAAIRGAAVKSKKGTKITWQSITYKSGDKKMSVKCMTCPSHKECGQYEFNAEKTINLIDPFKDYKIEIEKLLNNI